MIEPTNGPNEVQNESSAREQIYVLGVGNIGKLLAHSLARVLSPSQITVLLHRPELGTIFEQRNNSINLITNNESNNISGLKYELLNSGSKELIKNLIVATKATQTVSAIEPLKDRLNEESSIVLAQNGKGTYEELIEKVFKDPKTCPAFLPTVFYHGVYALGPFESVHAGTSGFAFITILSNRPQGQFLLDSILKAPAVNAKAKTNAEVEIYSCEKLILNASLNPITALFRVLNGEILSPAPLDPLWKAVATESAHVLKKYLTEQGLELGGKFDSEKLIEVTKQGATITAKNRSSMLQDVVGGRETEIQYINGWIVTQGKRLGVPTPLNEKLVEDILARKIFPVEEEAVQKEFGHLL